MAVLFLLVYLGYVSSVHVYFAMIFNQQLTVHFSVNSVKFATSNCKINGKYIYILKYTSYRFLGLIPC